MWAMSDLNLRPKDYESSALTAELMARNCTKKYVVKDNILEIFGQWEGYWEHLHHILHKLYILLIDFLQFYSIT